MATDCTADFVVEDNDNASADIRINGSGAKTRPGQNRSSAGGAASAAGKRQNSKAYAEAVEPIDAHRLSQRQKMIDKGKNTLGYQRYLQLKPKGTRSQSDPVTPDIAINGSKRRFDGLVQAWRRQLHHYDEEGDEAAMAVEAAAKGAKASGQGRETPEGAKGASAWGQPARSPQEEDGYVMVDRHMREEDEESQESQGSLDAYLGPAYKGGEKAKKQGLKRTLDASTAPAPPPATGVLHRSGLRAQAAAWAPQTIIPHQSIVNLEPQPKRSATSRSMDASMLASTCSNPPLPTAAAGAGGAAPKGAPTSFAGMGLASKVSGGASGAGGVHGSYVAAATKATAAPAPPKARVPKEDNIVALILGPEAGSCMSWASDA